MGQKRALEFLEPELQTPVSCPVGAGNPTWVLVRTAGAPNHWVVSPALGCMFLLYVTAINLYWVKLHTNYQITKYEGGRHSQHSWMSWAHQGLNISKVVWRNKYLIEEETSSITLAVLKGPRFDCQHTCSAYNGLFQDIQRPLLSSKGIMYTCGTRTHKQTKPYTLNNSFLKEPSGISIKRNLIINTLKIVLPFWYKVFSF